MKLILKYIAALVALVFNFHAGAQENSLLWKVSGKGLSKPSYLFGTIHMICPSDYIWTSTMKSSLEKADKLCLEMDMDDMNVTMAAASGMMETSGKKLSSYFTPDEYQLVKRYAKDSLGLDISLMEMMKPVALQALFIERGAVCSNAVSYEENLMKAVKDGKKEVVGLESVQDQLKALESMSVDSMVKELVEMAKDKGVTATGEFKKMVAAYKEQDLGKLHALMLDGDEAGIPTDALLNDRNKKWASAMPGMMNKNSIFFAVGAGHLWGDKGVIKLLQEQGYKVEPLK
jgi:uncharacterized protein